MAQCLLLEMPETFCRNGSPTTRRRQQAVDGKNARSPGRNIRILAEDDNAKEWLGFREPRELARFSHYPDMLARSGKSICYAGAMLWLGLLLLRFPKNVVKIGSSSCKNGSPSPGATGTPKLKIEEMAADTFPPASMSGSKSTSPPVITSGPL